MNDAELIARYIVVENDGYTVYDNKGEVVLVTNKYVAAINAARRAGGRR